MRVGCKVQQTNVNSRARLVRCNKIGYAAQHRGRRCSIHMIYGSVFCTHCPWHRSTRCRVFLDGKSWIDGGTFRGMPTADGIRRHMQWVAGEVGPTVLLTYNSKHDRTRDDLRSVFTFKPVRALDLQTIHAAVLMPRSGPRDATRMRMQADLLSPTHTQRAEGDKKDEHELAAITTAADGNASTSQPVTAVVDISVIVRGPPATTNEASACIVE